MIYIKRLLLSIIYSALIITPININNNEKQIDYEIVDQHLWKTCVIEIDRATVYQAVPWQTNEDNFNTASMFRLNKKFNHYQYRVLAISRDLLKHLTFGDTVYVKGTDYEGLWVVNDLMNKRFTKTIDFLIDPDMPNGLWHDVHLIKRKNDCKNTNFRRLIRSIHKTRG